MRKKGKALLAALLLLLVLTGCGADDAAQPEPGTVAAAMAEITAEKIDDGFTDKYPHITVKQLVTALHDAVSCEITKEEAEAAGYGQEDGWCVIIPVSGSHDPGLSCDETPDIVQVTDTSVLYSSSYPHPEGSIAYFRCHALYQLVSQCREETPAVAERMAAIRPEDIGSLYYPNVTAQQLADALHGAAEHPVTGEQAQMGDSYLFWQIDIYEHKMDVRCGLTENMVLVTSYDASARDGGYFEDETLYDLVRHCRDYDEVVDQTAYAAFKSKLDARMQRTLDTYATNPGEFHAYQLTRFTKLWQYATEDGNRAEVYQFDYALIPDKPLEIGWAGGVYLDSQLRMQGFNDAGKVVARYKDDTFLGLVFMQYDDIYWTLFDEDWEWANDMLAAMEEAL